MNSIFWMSRPNSFNFITKPWLICLLVTLSLTYCLSNSITNVALRMSRHRYSIVLYPSYLGSLGISIDISSHGFSTINVQLSKALLASLPTGVFEKIYMYIFRLTSFNTALPKSRPNCSTTAWPSCKNSLDSSKHLGFLKWQSQFWIF